MNVCTKFDDHPSNSCWDIKQKLQMQTLHRGRERKSKDRQSHCDKSSVLVPVHLTDDISLDISEFYQQSQ